MIDWISFLFVFILSGVFLKDLTLNVVINDRSIERLKIVIVDVKDEKKGV